MHTHRLFKGCFSELALSTFNWTCWSWTKQDILINSLKFNLFSPWYRWKISHLALNSNHSLISIAIDNLMAMVMTFNTTFNNISAVLWQSVLLLGETRVPEYQQKTTDLLQFTDKLYHIMLYWIHLAMSRIRKVWLFEEYFSHDGHLWWRVVLLNETLKGLICCCDFIWED